MSNRTKCVLHVIHGDAFGGVESWLISILPIISENIKLKVLVCDKTIHPALLKVFELYAIKCIHIPITNNILSYYNQLIKSRSFFKDLDFVHLHIYFKSILCIPFFKIINKKIILHNHSAATEYIKKWHQQLIFGSFKYFLNWFSNIKIAVSEKSYKDLFNNKIDKHKIIPCGVSLNPIEDYIANIDKQQQRKKTDRLSILHIGRFYESAFFENAKNQAFIIDILVELDKMGVPFEILFLGEGDKRVFYKQLEHLNFKKYVRFLEYTSDKAGLFYQADIFLFPSKHEGYGMSLVEAQLAGCRCLVSNTIPDEAIFSDNVKKISLKDAPVIWATALLTLHNEPLKDSYNDNIHYASLFENAKKLMMLYELES